MEDIHSGEFRSLLFLKVFCLFILSFRADCIPRFSKEISVLLTRSEGFRLSSEMTLIIMLTYFLNVFCFYSFLD